MSSGPAVRIVDTTLRDGSHAIAHQLPRRPGRDRRARARPRRRVGDRRRARRRPRRELDPVRPPAALRRRAARRRAGGRQAGADRDRDPAGHRHQGAISRRRAMPAPTVARVSTVCTEADIGVQHLGLARELGMTAHSAPQHRAPARPGRPRRAGADRGRRRQPGRLHRRLGRRVPDRRRPPPGRARCARRCRTTSRSGSTSTTTSRSRSPTRPRRSRRARRSSTRRWPASAPARATARPRRWSRCSSAWASRPASTSGRCRTSPTTVVRGEIMQRPIEIDRLTATMGYAAVPGQLPPARDPRRRAVRPRSARDHRRAGQAPGRRRPGGRDHRDRGRDGGDGGTHCVITVVLDDDPTGTQAMSDVSVVLDWSDAAVSGRARDPATVPSTCSPTRARTRAAEAGALIASAAGAARARVPGRPPASCAATARCARTCGRSTTRCAAVVAPGARRRAAAARAGPAGGGSRDHRRRAPARARRRARSARSHRVRPRRRAGLLGRRPEPLGGRAQRRPLRRGRRGHVPLERLRATDGAATRSPRRSRAAAESGRPAAVIPDAETDDDLRTIAAGLRARRGRAAAR